MVYFEYFQCRIEDIVWRKVMSINKNDCINLGRHTHNYENQITELEKQELCVFYCKEFIERKDIM